MNKAKLFIDNFLIYGLGSVISKIIPYVMIPIATMMMPDSSYYGISDMSDTIVSLCSAFAIMGMYDAMYRMFFEKDDEEYKKGICSTAFLFTAVMSIIVSICMILFRRNIANSFMGNQRYGYIIFITAFTTLVGATNSIIAAPTRMQNKRKTYIVINTVASIVYLVVSLIFLSHKYYYIALPIASLMSAVTNEIIFYLLNRKWFSCLRFELGKLIELLKIGIPLLPNFLIYWIFNSCDKLMVLHIIDEKAMGVYSAGAKISLASQLIYLAFAGGWQYFAFSTMKEDKQVENNSKVFEYLGVISFGISAIVISITPLIFHLIFKPEYYAGYIVVPYLFIAPLLQMLFQVACNQFLVVKKTWPNIFILSGGAIINILLNIILIPKLGIEGAAIATLMGYIISDIIAVIVLLKMRLMIVYKRFIIVLFGMTGFFMLWRFVLKEHILFSMLVAFLYVAFTCISYKKEVLTLKMSLSKKDI